MEKESYQSSIIKGSFWNFIMVLFGKIGGLIFVIILARYLLPESFGIYNLAVYITLFFITIADTGINQTLLKFFSEDLEKNKENAILRYRYLLRFKLFFVLLLAILLFISAYPLSLIFNKPDLFIPLLLLSIYLFVNSMESFFVSFFYIFKKVKYLAVRQLLWEALRILFLILLFNFIPHKYYILGAILILIISTFLSICFLIYSLKKFCPELFLKNDSCLEEIDKKNIRHFFFYIGLLNTLNLIFGFIDVIILGLFITSEFVGYYSAAWALISGFSAFFAISNILLPFFSKNKSSASINYSISSITKYISILNIPLIFGIFLLGDYIVISIYGYEYLPAVFPLLILSFMIFEYPLTVMLNSLFASKEKQNYLIKLMIISISLNLVLSFTIIPYLVKLSQLYVIIVVPCIIIFSRYLYLLLTVNYMNKNFNIKLDIYNIIKPFLCSLFMFLILYYINKHFLFNMNIFIGIVEVFAGIVIYFVAMFLVKGISKKDIYFLKTLID